MKGLILSGGKGTRLRPLTYTRAKQLIPVANKPILFYGIEALKAAGIVDIGIVVGDTGEEVKAAVGNGKALGVKVTYIQQEAPLGLAHAVKVSQEFLGDSNFVMYLGDNLITSGIVDLVEKFKKNRPNSMILLYKVENASQFGVAELKDGKVVKLVEKPKKPQSDLALVGVYMFDKNIFKAVSAIKPSSRGEFEITDAIQWLLDNAYTVEPHLVSGWWKDTGKVEDLLEANRIVLDTFETRIEGRVDKSSQVEFKVVIEKGAIIKNSQIRGPAIIGRNTVIENSYIGPFTSIDEGCTVVCSELDYSIVLAGSSILNIPRRIEESLIGRNTVIECSARMPKAIRIVVGQHSQVDLA